MRLITESSTRVSTIGQIYEYINCAASGIYVCLVDSDGEAIRGDTLKLSSVINYVIRGENSEKCLNLMIPGSFTHANRVQYTLGVNINKGTIINLHCVQRKIEEFYIYI